MFKSKYKIVPWIKVIIWMMLLFYFSSQPGAQSDGLSKKFTGTVINAVGNVVSADMQKNTVKKITLNYDHLVRKSAHFFIYFILGILVKSAFAKNNVKGYKSLLYSLAICFVFAGSDEFHQLFVPGRGAQFSDVMLDSCGAFTGIIFFVIISNVYNKKLKLRRVEK